MLPVEMGPLAAFDFGSFADSFVNWVWSPALFILLLGCGLIFSIASKFVQWRVMTHSTLPWGPVDDGPTGQGAMGLAGQAVGTRRKHGSSGCEISVREARSDTSPAIYRRDPMGHEAS